MRIIAGFAGGRNIKFPKTGEIRPTPDVVKGAIFSSLGDRIIEAEVLDLFCGTGALGLEAISRGARSVVFVDHSRSSMDCTKENHKLSSLSELPAKVTFLQMEFESALISLEKQERQFDIILADPPYTKKSAKTPLVTDIPWTRRLLADPRLPKLLKPDGRIYLEHFFNDLLQIPPELQEIKQLAHGDTIVTILSHRTS